MSRVLEMTDDECMDIFKKYGRSSYDYCMNNGWFFGSSARFYAAYLKERYDGK